MADKYVSEIEPIETNFMNLYNNLDSKLKKWSFFNKDEYGSKVYKKKKNILIRKPIKNLFAEEIIYQFWNTDKAFKMSWDESIDDIKLLEMVDSNTAILHVIFKSVLFVSKRDIIMYSQIKKIDSHTWIVINHSLPGYEEVEDIIRINMDVVMLVKEYLIDDNKPRDRNNIKCEMVYYGNINLKGWLSNDIVKYQCGSRWPNVLENLCKKTKLCIV